MADAPLAHGIVPWFGGKRRLAQRLVPMIDGTPHQSYVEPFLGGGGVFFRRQGRARSEVVNDRNRDLVTLMRVLQRHPDALLKELSTALSSRAEFLRLRAQPPELLTDIERAARFYSLQRVSFGGKVVGRTFGVSVGTRAGERLNMGRLEGELRGFHHRLCGVLIECLDWPEVLRRYDRPWTLFYVDPPYVGHEADYGRDLFQPADHERLAETLRGLAGRFILSLNDCKEARSLYHWARIDEAQVTYSAGGAHKPKRTSELIIHKLPDPCS